MPKLAVRDIDLYYEISGQGQPLLFIHGLGSSTRDWERQAAFFSRHYQVVTFDLRGHGKSDKPPGPYSVQLFAADTAELIESLAIGKTHVVGLSMGGMIAFQLALKTPDLVSSMVIVNSGPEFIVRTLKERLGLFQRFLVVRLLGVRQMGKVLARRVLPKPEHSNLRRIFIERWAENNKRSYLDSLRAMVGWSVTRHLSSITCPVLVVSADQDYTPVSYKEAYTERMARAELVVIPDSRHLTPVDQPDHFNEALLAFLSRQA
jgi:pimeloyl-ACP methyl ester carboxylesterase